METMFADQNLRFASGAVFTAPKGWGASHPEGYWVLQDPERALSIVLVEIPEAEDAVTAANEAWRLVRPGFSRDLREAWPLPDKEGWDHSVHILYETNPSEKRQVSASARLKDGTWYVLLLEGPWSALDRRAAQIRLITQSFRAPGVSPESFAGKKAGRLETADLEALAAFMEEARVQCAVPGAAAAVVQDGKVVFERCFGVGEKGKKEPVTPSTLFAVGSVSKPLTTLMMARLVERGVVRWDQSVLDLIPGFRLGDPETTRRLTLRHTVSASTGLPRQDMEWMFQPSNTQPEEVLGRMSTMKPTTEFGQVFQYSNTMVAAGGYIAAHASHPPMGLEEAFGLAIREEVFIPLGMYDSTLDIRSSLGRKTAVPHGENLWGDVKTMPLSIEGGLRPDSPAGGVWSNLRDMEKILLMELAIGKTPEGNRYLSEESLLERRKPQVKMDEHLYYALGWVVGEDCGVPMVAHSGETNGFISRIFLLPDHGVGVVILTNVSSESARFYLDAVQRKLMELLFKGRIRASADLSMQLTENTKQIMTEAAKVEPRPDDAWLEGLQGFYRNKALGRVEIRWTKEGGVFEAAEWNGALGRKVEKDGTVKAVLMTPPATWLEFSVGEQNGRKALSLDLPQQSYVFERIGDK